MICQWRGCKQLAIKVPVFSFAAKVAPKGPRTTGELSLCMCDEHAREENVQIPKRAWQQICDAMRAARKAAPDRSTLRIEFRPVEQSTFQSLQPRSIQ